MKIFEDILKNRLKDAVSRESVDADDLWADIAGALPAEEHKRRYPGLWLLLPFLVVAGGVLWFGISDNQMEIVNSNDVNIAVVEEEKKTIEPVEESENQVTNIETNVSDFVEKDKVKIAENTNIQTNLSQSKELTNSTKHDKRKESIINQKQQIATFEKNRLNTDIKSAKNLQTTQKTKTQNTSNSLTTNDLPNNELHLPVWKKVRTPEDQPPPQSKEINPLKSKTFFINQEEQEKDLTGFFQPINPLLKPIKKKKNLNFEIGAFSGINTVKNIFKNTTRGELLQNAYKLRLGYTVGTEFQVNLKNNLSFSTGLEYSKTMTQFNIVQEKDGFTDNPNTPIVDENEVRAKIVRTVRHHNRLDFLTVPLVVSKNKTFGKFDLGIGVGVSFNSVRKQTGKALNAWDNIDDYSYRFSQIPIVPYKNFFAYHLHTSIAYNATEKLSFQVRPELRYASHGSSNFFGIKHSTIMSSINLGLNFKL